MMTRTNGGTKRWILPDYPLVRIMYIMLNCTYYPYHLPPMVNQAVTRLICWRYTAALPICHVVDD